MTSNIEAPTQHTNTFIQHDDFLYVNCNGTLFIHSDLGERKKDSNEM